MLIKTIVVLGTALPHAISIVFAASSQGSQPLGILTSTMPSNHSIINPLKRAYYSHLLPVISTVLFNDAWNRL